MKTVVVIGGGITGLSAAYHLQQQAQENDLQIRLILVEAEPRLGGKIKTEHAGSFIMETGADSIVTRKLHTTSFMEELHLEDEVVYNATGASFLYSENQLKRIPEDTVFGIPLSIESLAKSNLVSAEGKVEALKDFYTKNDTFTEQDSVGAFLEHCFGEELVQKQISPVLSGVYSGQLNNLTIASTLPYLIEYKNKYGSIIKGLSENKHLFKTGESKFLSFKDGMSALIDAYEAKLSDARIIKGVKAESISKSGECYQIQLANQEMLEADFVVLSPIHSVAQTLLNDEQLDSDFNQLKNNSLISIYLGFDLPDHLLPENGTGYIVSNSSSVVCNACTWASRKWEHTATNNRLLVRLFYKSSDPAYPSLLQMSKDELKQVALRDIKNSLGITGDPIEYNVTKWHETMPNYHVKHPQLVRSLELKMAERFPNILLAGCSYYGVGIADCIENGQHTAKAIINKLSGVPAS
ncbi:protoporphyrinogen oxidase [Ammoniphilus oxalaticus]|uniref:Coproporphyrinogen III oxidase n=1 Tax=Ammoniphilus oxalaticus TaxID=66863 RepID=A0A419SFU5_9BACL|nr:protoporphyrinogen oxidase [Ammoniphilus oxalaticus]RKD22650.1 protoporphyrinogen oxidase [Ammoniphilus oxalaticus]